MKRLCIGIVILLLLAVAQSASAQGYSPCEQACYPQSGCSVPCDSCVGGSWYWDSWSSQWVCYGGGVVSQMCYDYNYPDCEIPPPPPDPDPPNCTSSWIQDGPSEFFKATWRWNGETHAWNCYVYSRLAAYEHQAEPLCAKDPPSRFWCGTVIDEGYLEDLFGNPIGFGNPDNNACCAVVHQWNPAVTCGGEWPACYNQ
jgi:hypothetical protein